VDLFESMCRRNPELVRAAATLHQEGAIQADCYVADLESIRRNAELVKRSAEKAGLRVYFEAKEVGRARAIYEALANLGFDKAIAIDIEEVYALERIGARVGHVGHLAQIPTSDVRHVVAEVRPEVFTVYSYEKAAQVAAAARDAGLTQKVLIRANGAKDIFSPAVAGGTPEAEALDLIDRIEALDGLSFAGLTTYPGVRFDLARRQWVRTTNFETMMRVRDAVEKRLDREVEQLNASGNNCADSFELLAKGGATHCEPGQAFVGGLVANGFTDQPEVPAIAYVSEVTHHWAGVPYYYAPSMVANNTIGIWHHTHYDTLGASVSRPGVDPLENLARTYPQSFAASDPTAWIYGALQLGRDSTAAVGDTVVCGFRCQVYRSNGGRLAVVDGIQTGSPTIVGLYDRTGNRLADRGGRRA
jgi:predicted amino acid racemase